MARKQTFPLVLDQEDIKHLKAIAAAKDVSVSAVARWIIGEHRGISFSAPARFDGQSSETNNQPTPATTGTDA